MRCPFFGTSPGGIVPFNPGPKAIAKHSQLLLLWALMNPLTPAEIRLGMPRIPHWTRRGAVLRRIFEFNDFVAAMTFVNSVARAAEKVQHHPDIDIRWNRVTLGLTTHDAGGLTERDFSLAERCNAIAEKLK